MKTIVTGGAGFIGSNLVERLIGDGHEVVVLDSLLTGRKENLEAVKSNPRFRFSEVDIADFDAISGYFPGVDWVFHLAALTSIVPSIEKPLDYFHSNALGTASVLEASRLAGVKRFIYTSTSACYGIPDNYPTSETAPVRTEHPYAATKYLGELLALHYCQVYKLPVVALRPFNVYGPRVRTDSGYGAVLGVFLAQKLNNKPFTIVGDGTQKRDWIYVTDMADAFIKAAESGVVGEVFNVGAGNPHSVNELVKFLGQNETVYIPKRPGEPDQTFADINKIKRMLGWQPQVTFEQGIEKVMLDIDQWKNAPVWTPEKISEATKIWFQNLSK